MNGIEALINVLRMENTEEEQQGGFCPKINGRCIEANCALWIHESLLRAGSGWKKTNRF
jgi:hypothetical protein